MKSPIVDGKKYCPKCATWKPVERFNALKRSPMGIASHCKDCKQTWTRKTEQGRKYKRASMKRWQVANSEKTRAHLRVLRAVKSGKLIKLPCVICGDPNVHGHHHNGYDHPLEVTWLCPLHHREEHSKIERR